MIRARLREGGRDLSLSNEYSTRWPLVRACAEVWGRPTLDAAAARWNAKASRYFTKRENGLKQSWGGLGSVVWCNPPYSRGNLAKWMAKARAESRLGATVICLVPAYPSEGWWLDHVHGQLVGVTGRLCPLGPVLELHGADGVVAEVVTLAGRQRFIEKGGKTGSARFASAVVVFRPSSSLVAELTRRAA